MIFPGERILPRTFAFLHPRLQVAAVKEYMTAYADTAAIFPDSRGGVPYHHFEVSRLIHPPFYCLEAIVVS